MLSAVSGGASQASTSSLPGAASTSDSDFTIDGEDAAAGSSNQQSSTSPDAWGSSGVHHSACIHRSLLCCTCSQHAYVQLSMAAF